MIHLRGSLSLSDKQLFNALQMNIHTNGYDFKTGSEIMAVCYRVYYKVLNTLNPKAKQISFPGTTTLVQTNLLTSNIATNRLIRWKEIDFPETWSLPQEVEPEPIINKEIGQITQTTEGDVEIRFNPQRSIKIPRSISSRYSLNDFYSTSSNLPRTYSTSSNLPRSSIFEPISKIRDDLESVEHIIISENKIPHGIYQANAGPSESRKSPTESEMSFHLHEQ
jgi:hypothetical protein